MFFLKPRGLNKTIALYRLQRQLLNICIKSMQDRVKDLQELPEDFLQTQITVILGPNLRMQWLLMKFYLKNQAKLKIFSKLNLKKPQKNDFLNFRLFRVKSLKGKAEVTIIIIPLSKANSSTNHHYFIIIKVLLISIKSNLKNHRYLTLRIDKGLPSQLINSREKPLTLVVKIRVLINPLNLY